MLQCGAYEIDITPTLGLPIPGYFHERFATGIKDSLYARAMAIRDDDKVLVLISLDALAIVRDIVIGIRQRVFQFTKVPTENIMVSSIHSHTAGPVDFSGKESLTDGYSRYLIEKAADAAIIAFRCMKPARIGFGTGFEKDIAFNRRYFMKDGSVKTNPGINNPDILGPAGPTDPEVGVMRIDDSDGNPMAVVTNYACHLDTIGGTEYSADYPGVLNGILKKALGQNTVSFFLTGACGNINHINISDRSSTAPEHYKKMGVILAGEVIKVREKIVTESHLKLDIRDSHINVGIRKPVDSDLANAGLVIKSIPKRKTDDWDNEQIELYFAEQLLEIYKRQEWNTDIEIQVFKLGDMAITAVPCELFVEFGLEIKKRSGAGYNFVNTLANGIYGYVATKEAFRQGGYEVRLSEVTKLAEDTGNRIEDCAVEMIDGMFGKKGSIHNCG